MSRTYKIASAALAGALMLTAFGAHAQNWNGGSMFGRYDGDKDGKISQSEYETGRQNAFSRVDTDANGALSFAEIDAAIAMATQRGGAMAQVMQSRMAALKAADTDGDSVISADEYKAAADAEFKTLDTDADGFVSEAELQAAMPGH